MAKSKLNEVLKRLGDIETWASMGLSESQIAYNLGISRSSLENYKKQNLDILNSLKRGKSRASFKVENALYKKATGYVVKEQVPTKVKETYYDDNGNKCIKENVVVVEAEKEVPADIQAIKFWLINKEKGKWKENPTKAEIDRAMLELRKEQAKQGDW
ncbi:Xaa-His dipeptidase [Clostridium paraputrificum]|uniref:Xaa-His dipeptidase n=1 Tax=Clostridium TaxID=1485 RepID=UPI00290283A3|nr:Xaa-His dipeptidase [Clostridium sp.]MDU2285234.1 Xaa-His dipeptidase [Clostridium sp.]